MTKEKVSLNPNDARSMPTWDEILTMPLPEGDTDYISARTSVLNLDVGVRVLARHCGIGVGETFRRLTKSAACFVKADKRVAALVTPYSDLDDSRLDRTRSVARNAAKVIPFQFCRSDAVPVKYPAWDKATKSYLMDTADVCGVNGYCFAILYIVKALVDTGIPLRATRGLFDEELECWDDWLEYRKIVLPQMSRFTRK
jgi:hypothetical protein